MKSMKKFLAVAMILLMTAALAACGGDTKDSGSSDSSADAPKASGDVLIVGTEPRSHRLILRMTTVTS